MGLAKVSLMAPFIAMAANLRLTDTFHLRQQREAAHWAAGVKPRTRKPRWRTRQLTALRERLAAHQDARLAADAQAGEPARLRLVADPPRPQRPRPQTPTAQNGAGAFGIPARGRWRHFPFP
jgi:hypothetical protein